MPAKPAWYARLDEIVADLTALPSPWITRGTIEFLLGVGPRRAQQIMKSCAVEQVGTSLVADRQLLMAHLTALARGESAHYELQRQRKLATALQRLRDDYLARPKVLIEAPVEIVNQRIDDLPRGIDLSRGRITVEFRTPVEALEKLLALAMAIGQDPARFEQIIST